MNQNCKVCGEPAAGFHFGAFTCEGCKVGIMKVLQAPELETFSELSKLKKKQSACRCVCVCDEIESATQNSVIFG